MLIDKTYRYWEP